MAQHFEFGENWTRFLALVDEPRVARATMALQTLVRRERLDGLTFLDVGSGSGLSSLSAHRLGARVHAFDDDPQSVACTQELKRRFAPCSTGWTIESGSALDENYLSRLGTFDIVYSWGVLHHTGDLWSAVDLVSRRVAPGAMLLLAIYNDQGQTSERWRQVKALYQRLPKILRSALVGTIGAGMFARRLWSTFTATVLRVVLLRNPLLPLQMLVHDLRVPEARGMHRWYDLVDWVGGWPFQVATPEAVFRRLRAGGFVLEDLKTCGGGLGCNEFVFRKDSVSSSESAAAAAGAMADCPGIPRGSEG